MMTKNKELAEKYFPYEYEIVDTPYFGYEIQIQHKYVTKSLYNGELFKN